MEEVRGRRDLAFQLVELMRKSRDFQFAFLALLQGGRAHRTGDAVGSDPPRVVNPEGKVFARIALDVVERGKGVLALGRGVAAHAVDAKARVGILQRPGRHVAPDLAPEPAIPGRSSVFDHEGPVRRLQGGLRRVGVLDRRRVILLFQDHGPVGDRALATVTEPGHHLGRVIDPHGGVGSIIGAVDKRTGVAHRFVHAPAEIPVLVGLQVAQDLLFERDRLTGRKIVGQPQRGWHPLRAGTWLLAPSRRSVEKKEGGKQPIESGRTLHSAPFLSHDC